MRILITGGAGFIGSHITKLLLNEGHEVMVFDNSAGNLERLENVIASVAKQSSSELEIAASPASWRTPRNDNSGMTLLNGDIKDSEALEKALGGVDAVIHMASLIEVSESVKYPLKFAENNIMGSINLLEAMKEKGVKRIIFSSSATVYGEPKTLPLTEGMPLDSANPYAASKIAVEQFLSAYHKNHGFDVTILRYFNPYGPGEEHEPETHAIPNFIKNGLDKKPVPLYWKGEQTRDFIYIEDLAKAHTVVLDQSGFNIFNVGTEQGVRIIDVINKLSDILGYTLEVEDLGDRPGDVRSNYASSQKLKESTGWSAQTDLNEGLRKTVEWFKSRENF